LTRQSRAAPRWPDQVCEDQAIQHSRGGLSTNPGPDPGHALVANWPRIAGV